MITPINPDNNDLTTLPLSPALKVGDYIYVSGQAATNPDGSAYIGLFEKEVNGTIDNIEKLLKAVGSGLHDVVKVTSFLANPVLFAEYNEIYKQRFNHHPRPARSTIAVAMGNPDVRVEIEVVAYVGER